MLDVTLMSQQLALPREGHLEQVLHIIGYLKQHPKLRLMFDSDSPKVNENWFLVYDWEDFIAVLLRPYRPTNLRQGETL